MRIAVTTSLHPSREEEQAAAVAAGRWSLTLAARGRRSTAELLEAEGLEALLVLTRLGASLVLPPHPALPPAGAAEGFEPRAGARVHLWSPGMGALRAKRVARLLAAGAPAAGGERDPFFEASGIRAGDAVLDCTLGLGADALVAAVAAGPSGRVVGVERSPALAAWVGEGLARSPLPAAGRVEVRAAGHEEVLRSLPDRSFDVVLFDPMFRHARAEPGGFDVVRRLADAGPLTLEAVARARRVARRWVVVKDGAPGWDLARLGLTPLPSARGAHRYYARVPAE